MVQLGSAVLIVMTMKEFYLLRYNTVHSAEDE
jgi:hypothetical protein